MQAVVCEVSGDCQSCSGDAAGQGGERQVNYCTERGGQDALHSPLWPAVLGFQCGEGGAKEGVVVMMAWR